MKITRTVLLISLSVLVALPILNWSCQKKHSFVPSAEGHMWQRRFYEFHDALGGYNQRPDLFSNAVGYEEGKLFPSDFGILEKYGDIERREHLRNAQEFREFQSAVVIDIENEEYFYDMQLDLDSFLAGQSVILHKDLISDDRKVRIILTYDGTVFRLYPNSFAEPINRDYRRSFDGRPKE